MSATRFGSDDDHPLHPLTSTVEHAHESRRTEVAFLLESLQGERLRVHLRNGRTAEAAVVTVRNGRGWLELEQRDGEVRLDPIGWTALADIIAVIPVDPVPHLRSA